MTENGWKIMGPEEIVYLNGDFLPLAEARISPVDRGFLYGDGLFETLRADGGRVFYLAAHLERLRSSLAVLRMPSTLPLPGAAVLEELLAHNDLVGATAAVKVVVTRGAAGALGLPPPERPTVCALARRYQPPSAVLYKRGWRLHVSGQRLGSPLACHKSLNYLVYQLARQEAVDAGADEAVLLDCRERLAEAAAGSLLVRTRGQWWTPASPCQLPGITVRQTVRLLAAEGVPVGERSAGVEDLAAAETVWVLNSLMGIMPAYEVGRQRLPDPRSGEAERLRLRLFAHG